MLYWSGCFIIGDMKRVLFWTIIILILGGTVFVLAMLPRKEAGPANNNGQTAEVPSITATDWVKGSPEAGVTLVEYGDFQCPACAAYHPLVDKLLKEKGQNFQFVYRHFPLRQHNNAKPAAYAAEAAGRQGKFFEMYDLIYQGQTNWAEKINPKDIFLDYARSLNLNLEQYNKDFNSAEAKGRVEADLQSAIKLGVNSTPTFYLMDSTPSTDSGQASSPQASKRIQPRNYDEFASLIKQTNVDSINSPQATPNATP